MDSFLNQIEHYKTTKMLLDSCLKVLVYIDGYQIDLNAIHSKEFKAIVDQVKKLWPDDMFNRVWYDIETSFENENDELERRILVACYEQPTKSKRASIPIETLNRVLNRKIRIFPVVRNLNADDIGIVRDLNMHEVEVIHVR